MDLLVVLLLLGQFTVFPLRAHASEYMEGAWGESFPELETRFDDLSFENENSFKLVTFSAPGGSVEIVSREFKLFDNHLTAVVHKYAGALTSLMEESYIKRFVTSLGGRIKTETKEIPTPQGMTATTLWEYEDLQIFFQTYPGKSLISGTPRPANMIKFVHKPTYARLKAYIREHPDGDPDAMDDDFDAVSF